MPNHHTNCKFRGNNMKDSNCHYVCHGLFTIHKPQGLTLELARIDLGKSERVAGLSYVAISRVRNVSNCVIEPMSFERLQSIKKSTNFLYRIEEEQRLRNLAQLTLHKYKNTL